MQSNTEKLGQSVTHSDVIFGSNDTMYKMLPVITLQAFNLTQTELESSIYMS